MNNISRIFRKEMLSVLRERRVLFTTLVLPIFLMPIMMFGPSLMFGNAAQKTVEEVQKVGVIDLPEPVLQALKSAKLEPVPTQDPLSETQNKKIQAAVAFKDGQYTIYGRLSGATQSSLVVDKIETALRGYKDSLVQKALQEKGLSPSILEPFKVTKQDTSPKQEQAAGLFAFLIPYFLVLFILIGGQTVAVDTTAGEKEKGTLEALLVTPVPLHQVVVGKALATLVMALAAALASVTGIVLGSVVARTLFSSQLGAMGGANLGGGLSLSLAGYASLFVTAALFAAFIVSVQLSLGLYARSFKEAQSYMAPLQFVFIIPLLALQFADFLSQQTWYYAIPAFNVMLLLDGLVKGSAQGWQLALTWVSTVVFAMIALFVAIRNFRREEVVFRN